MPVLTIGARKDSRAQTQETGGGTGSYEDPDQHDQKRRGKRRTRETRAATSEEITIPVNAVYIGLVSVDYAKLRNDSTVAGETIGRIGIHLD